MIEHGTVSCYSRGCRQKTCLQASLDYHKERRRRIRDGRWNPHADPAPVIAHLRFLRRRYTFRQIAAESRISVSTIHEILSGRQKHVRRQTYDALMGVK